MNAALFAFTARGVDTARRIRGLLAKAGDGAEIYAPEKHAGEDVHAYTGALSDFVGALFRRDALIFVSACGIAVRAVASHVSDKLRDPAVLCVDERGQFVIPILSGHVGGANRLARRVAEGLGAVPVITTATDVNGRFSVDAWAAERGMAIADRALAKRVYAELLSRDMPIWAPDREPPERLPEGLAWRRDGELGVCVSCRDDRPFRETLLLVPRALCVGIGCRRGVDPKDVARAVDGVFAEHRLLREAVAGAATIDIKADEAGLLAFCRRRGWPIAFYNSEELRAVRGSVSPSAFVRDAVGVDNVCERAALAGGGRLIVPKTALGGVTVAVAEREWRLDLGEDSRGGHRPRGL